MEEWLPVPGHEGVYEVSSLGRVRRVLAIAGTRAGKILRGFVGSTGYEELNLSAGARSVRHRAKVHRLVLSAFRGQPTPEQVGNHLNGNRTDNRLENLEWTTVAGNTSHAIHSLGRKCHAKAGEGHRYARRVDLEELARLRMSGLTQREAGRRLGVSRELVNRIENRRHWSQR